MVICPTSTGTAYISLVVTVESLGIFRIAQLLDKVFTWFLTVQVPPFNGPSDEWTPAMLSQCTVNAL